MCCDISVADVTDVTAVRLSHCHVLLVRHTVFHCRTATVRDGCSERVGHYVSCPPEQTMREYPAAFFDALKALHTPTTALGSKRSIEPDRTLKVCCVQSEACGRRLMRLDGDTRGSARPWAEERVAGTPGARERARRLRRSSRCLQQ